MLDLTYLCADVSSVSQARSGGLAERLNLWLKAMNRMLGDTKASTLGPQLCQFGLWTNQVPECIPTAHGDKTPQLSKTYCGSFLQAGCHLQMENKVEDMNLVTISSQVFTKADCLFEFHLESQVFISFLML